MDTLGRVSSILLLTLSLSAQGCRLQLRGAPSEVAGWVPPVDAGVYRVTAQPYFSTELNGSVVRPKISSDGYWVAFGTNATNWGASDTNSGADVLAVNLDTQEVIHVNSDIDGVQSNGGASLSANRAFSADGKFILFEAEADNLVAGTTTTHSCYAKNLETGEVTLISSDSSGVQAATWSTCGAFSADGTKAYFTSFGAVVAGDTNSQYDVFEKDLFTGVVTRLTTDSSGNQLTGGNSFFADISDDGRYLLFTSATTNAVAGDTNALDDLFLKDLQTGTVEMVTVAWNGGLADNAVAYGSFYDRANPDLVVFGTYATNIVVGVSDNEKHVYLRDMSAGETALVSKNKAGVTANGANAGIDAAVSVASAGMIGFTSSATNYISGDPGVQSNLFIKNLSTGAMTLVDETEFGGFPDTVGSASYPDASSNGKVWVYRSHSTNIVTGDTNGTSDVFVRVFQ